MTSLSPAVADEGSLPLVAKLPPGSTAESAFAAMASLPYVAFFDSAVRGPRDGRYSYVTADPYERLEVPADGREALTPAEQLWRRAAAGHRMRANLPPFQGGLAGLLGYELARSLERLPPPNIDDLGLPAVALGAYDVVAAFDHVTGDGWLVSQGAPESDPTLRYERAAARLAQFQRLLAGGSAAQIGPRRHDAAAAAASNRPPGDVQQIPDAYCPEFVTPIPGVTSNLDAAEHQRRIQQALDYIRASDVFQVNLAQRLSAPWPHSPTDLYRRLRQANPAPYAGYLDGGRWQLASASPECFLCLRGERLETRPIKGTRARLTHAAADLFLGDELEASEKDRAENVMIVDLLRNDLSRICEDDSVRVEQLFRRETYAFVQHLTSVVAGRLRSGVTPFDVLRATFPGGSITGAPKVRAMEILAALEPTARGAYCGSLAWIGGDGAMDANILIRTITCQGGRLTFPVGGGVVAQSDPQVEQEETWHKARGLLRAIQGDDRSRPVGAHRPDAPWPA